MFVNREQAGEMLAGKVSDYLTRVRQATNRVVVVGLPRGGVPVAFEVARQLQCPLTICCAKKIPCPGQPEYGIGAVSSSGMVIYDKSLDAYMRDLQPYLQQQAHVLVPQARQREQRFLQAVGMQQIDFKGKTAIVVDDGIATGATAIAAMRTLRELGAQEIILATPVVCRTNLPALMQECDEVITLLLPEEFHAVGLFYEDFTQTTDEEVEDCLREAKHFYGNARVQLASNQTV